MISIWWLLPALFVGFGGGLLCWHLGLQAIIKDADIAAANRRSSRGEG